jgi:RiboL-PSP-HEPN
MENFWDDSNRIIKGDLDTLVDKRNLIAHGHFEATATQDDVIRYVESARKLADLLDARIERHLEDLRK